MQVPFAVSTSHSVRWNSLGHLPAQLHLCWLRSIPISHLVYLGLQAPFRAIPKWRLQSTVPASHEGMLRPASSHFLIDTEDLSWAEGQRGRGAGRCKHRDCLGAGVLSLAIINDSAEKCCCGGPWLCLLYLVAFLPAFKVQLKGSKSPVWPRGKH